MHSLNIKWLQIFCSDICGQKILWLVLQYVKDFTGLLLEPCSLLARQTVNLELYFTLHHLNHPESNAWESSLL